MDKLPKLPHNLKPTVVFTIDAGTMIVIQCEDEKNVYWFYWDGVSTTYNKLYVNLKVDFSTY